MSDLGSAAVIAVRKYNILINCDSVIKILDCNKMLSWSSIYVKVGAVFTGGYNKNEEKNVSKSISSSICQWSTNAKKDFK